MSRLEGLNHIDAFFIAKTQRKNYEGCKEKTNAFAFLVFTFAS